MLIYVIKETMLKNYSEVQQMQNELQWWIEQKMSAMNEGDLQYVLECKDNEEKLTKEILNIN
jgi:hypothetical protein